MRYDVGRFRRPMRRSTEGQLMSLISLGDGSTLTLDFTTGVLDPRLTFTRASTGTFINASGNVATASNNVARFDHDPTTLAPRGLLVEGTATNVCEQGQYCWGAGTTSSWGRSAGVNINSVNGTAGANAVPRIDGPDGGSLTGTSIFKDSGSTFVRLNQNVAVVQNTTYTWSAYVRAPSGGNPYIRLAAFNGGTWLNTTGGCTLSSVTITNTVGGGSIFNGVPSGSWVRVWVTFTTQAAQTTATIAFYPDADTSNAATMYCWGAQVETGSGPSSVIPTGASTVQRLRDEVVLSNLSGISFNQSAGTVYSQVEIVEKLRGSFRPYGSFDTSGGGRCWWWLFHNHDTSVGQRILGTAFNSGGSTAITSSNYTHSSGVFKFATSLDPVAGRMVYAIAGGSAQVTNASGFTLATAAQMSLNKNNDVAATDLGSMWVRSIKYWPTALPDATLQSLTT